MPVQFSNPVGIPAITSTQRDAMAAQPAGSLIENTTTGALEIRRSSAWKRTTAKRTGTTTSSSFPTINTDNVDYYSITALSTAITSFTGGISGSPVDGQTLWISIIDNGTARAITWGSAFESSTILLPTTTVAGIRLDVGFVYNNGSGLWRCVAVA